MRRLGTVAAMLLCVAATCSFSACSDDEEAPPSPVVEPDPSFAESRTVMVYLAAENSLASAASSDVLEILSGMKDETLQEGDRVLLYVDDTKLPRIYEVDKHTAATSLADLQPVKTYDADVNSASAEQLGRFLDFARNHAPAESYGLVLWSHASGWIPSDYEGDAETGAPRRSFGIDNGKNSTSNTGNQMNLGDMARVLEEWGGVDFIFFDACFMQCAEVAYALRNATHHVFGSPAEIPAPGANYQTMVPAMFRKDYVEPMLTAYYEEYGEVGDSYGIVFSVISTEGMERFASYMKTLLAVSAEALLATDRTAVLNYYDYLSWGRVFPDYCDMQGLMKQVLDGTDFAAWKDEVDRVVTCRHADYWYSAYKYRYTFSGTTQIDDAQCCGMSMYVPAEDDIIYKFNAAFRETEWAKDVWGYGEE